MIILFLRIVYRMNIHACIIKIPHEVKNLRACIYIYIFDLMRDLYNACMYIHSIYYS